VLRRGFTESAQHAKKCCTGGLQKAHNTQKTKLTGNANSWKAISYSLKKGKWWAATLVNTLRMAKMRSNLYTGQISFDHSQGQVLVELLLLARVTSPAWSHLMDNEH